VSSTAESNAAGDTSVPPAAESPLVRRGGLVGGLIRTARPRQWVKNVLVLAAPFAAYAANPVFRMDVVTDAAIAFVAFCLVASAVYLVNDAIDAEADRAHPTKRNRPIAAGIVPVRVAYVVAVALFLASFAVSLVSSWRLLVVIGVYAAVQIGYCLGLKHQPVIDLCIVASGFLLRAIAGGAAAGLPLSQWFLLVTAFGSLFMVAGRREDPRVPVEVLGELSALRVGHVGGHHDHDVLTVGVRDPPAHGHELGVGGHLHRADGGGGPALCRGRGRRQRGRTGGHRPPRPGAPGVGRVLGRVRGALSVPLRKLRLPSPGSSRGGW